MRFHNFITETFEMSPGNWEKLKSIIDEKCQPFLKEKGSWENMLFRGVKSPPKTWDERVTRTDRRPRLLSTELHDFLGKLTKKMFGWNTRTEGVFTTSKLSDARAWGQASIVFPIGKFQYIWIDSTDVIYSLYDNRFMTSAEAEGMIEKEMKNYQSKNLKKYLSTPYGGGECIVKCDKYLMINYEWKETLLEYYR